MSSNQNPNNIPDEEEEPSPEMLSNNIVKSTQGTSLPNNNNLNFQGQPSLDPSGPSNQVNLTVQPSPPRRLNQTNAAINNSMMRPNASLNASKAYTCMPTNSIYENFDIQQLAYSIVKDYNQLRISKDESFIERMKFDIYKRQIKEDRINKLIEQNKIKIDEEERIKAFNRLIEDANRRMEAKENLEAMKNKLETDLYAAPSKKYKTEEWNNIYEERFKGYQDKVDKEIQDKIKEKQEIEKLKEMEEAEMCKTKKGTQEEIDKSSKRLYEESIKRRIKMEQKLSKINYENDPNKYKKILKNNYNFLSDDEDGGNSGNNCNNNCDDYYYENNNNNNNYMGNNNNNLRGFKKNGKVSVTEYNNKRFDVCNNKNNVNMNVMNHNKNNNKCPLQQNNNLDYMNNMNNINNNQGYFEEDKNYINNLQNKNNTGSLEKYMQDEDEIEDIPKPITNNEVSNNSNTKVKKDKKKNSNIQNVNYNINPIDPRLFSDNSANNKILDDFFNKKNKY